MTAPSVIENKEEVQNSLLTSVMVRTLFSESVPYRCGVKAPSRICTVGDAPHLVNTRVRALDWAVGPLREPRKAREPPED